MAFGHRPTAEYGLTERLGDASATFSFFILFFLRCFEDAVEMLQRCFGIAVDIFGMAVDIFGMALDIWISFQGQ